MKRCCACNGRFGLIRYRLAQKSFCSKLCRDKYRADTERKVSRINQAHIVLESRPIFDVLLSNLNCGMIGHGHWIIDTRFIFS
jgi:hypothetical protein